MTCLETAEPLGGATSQGAGWRSWPGRPQPTWAFAWRIGEAGENAAVTLGRADGFLVHSVFTVPVNGVSTLPLTHMTKKGETKWRQARPLNL